MSTPRFRFADTFDLAAPPTAVIAVLRDADTWPQWWPQIRAVQRIDERTGAVQVRSHLPMTLRLRLTSLVDEPDTGRFRAGLDGDLRGWVEFRATGSPAGTQVAYEQECDLCHPVLGRLAAALQPVLTWNHTAMMRAGMTGLERHAQRYRHR